MSTPSPPVVSVRRIRAEEWLAVRALRIESTSDPAAAIAFLERPEEVAARSDEFWMERAKLAASSDTAAQFVATVDEAWIGSLTVVIRHAGQTDHLGQRVVERRADVVGVYVRPRNRGGGAVDGLLTAAAHWVAAHGLTTLKLDVHRDNVRAQRAYRRAGFRPTGVVFSSAIGDEIEMMRPLAPPEPEVGGAPPAGMVPT